MMEVLADGTVALRTSKPASFRQRWEKEPFGTIGFRCRNLATNSCLINGAGQPVSVQTGQAPPADSPGLLRLRPASFVASLGPVAEYFGM